MGCGCISFVSMAILFALAESRSLTYTDGDGLMQSDDSSPCHGMNCKDWHVILNKLRLAQAMLTGKTPSEADAAAAAEGCFRFSEEQVDSILNKLMEEERPIGHQTEDEQKRAARIREIISAIMGHSNRKRKLANFESSPNRKWHNPIYYKFDGTHNEQEMGKVRSAFEHWQESTCLRFFEVPEYAPIYQSHIRVTRASKGCYSFLGKVFSRGQPLNLASSCFLRFGVPLHEIGHTLGFYHEHQRADRDEWIDLLEDNIDVYNSQFWKVDTEDYGVPYDYTSVMHYSSKTGSYQSKHTMVAKDPLYTKSMGQRTGLSYLDIKLANLAYCSGSCSGSLEKSCEVGGYQDPNDCTRCRCPDGFAGAYCEDLATSFPDGCGEDIVLEAGKKVQVNSPGYTDQKHYEDYQECTWRFKVAKDQRISMEFTKGEDFGVYCRNNEVCYHWVEVKYRADLEYPGPRFCCHDAPNIVLISEENEMLIIFRANFTTAWSTDRRGFSATMWAVNGDGSELQLNETTLVSETTTSPVEFTTEDPAGTSWSEWGWCQNSQCKCGGCSMSTRHRMCGETRCTGDLYAEESRPCEEYCSSDDMEIKVKNGQFVGLSCLLHGSRIYSSGRKMHSNLI
ncbi:hypothetical protein CAPTEDRAFT_221461 [Capitella teleta]|uniref:Metalloendopeptidase n=1 Tax=Capitella teleta TaxID=283909 RepID=R7TV87_CAPTE|nr:hypothetical protein CAPTEDRAFT_221461 [Capitella teleta]|eukprot:ELT97502.1 hypothetical protein CAPTEDRAFT_221461 [Capitella teleta]